MTPLRLWDHFRRQPLLARVRGTHGSPDPARSTSSSTWTSTSRPILGEYGAWTYLILFLIIFCETGLVVTPSCRATRCSSPAGAFAARGSLSLPGADRLADRRRRLGDTVNYWVGPLPRRRACSTSKRFRLIKPEHLAYTHEFYEKYGGKTIIIARFVPIVRTLAPFVAGLGSMSYGRFMSYNVIGGVAWVVICTLAGYLLRQPAVRAGATSRWWSW